MADYTESTDFTHGELCYLFGGRSDLSIYQKSASKIQNMFVHPSGAVQTRFGTEMTFALPASVSSQQGGTVFFGFPTLKYNYILACIADTTYPFRFENATGTKTALASLDVDIKDYSISQNTVYTIDHESLGDTITSNQSTGALTTAAVTFKNEPVYEYDTSYTSSTFHLSKVDVGNETIITVASGSFTFTDDHIDGTFNALGPTTSNRIGAARIISRTNSTTVVARITSTFASIDPKPGTPPLGEFNGTECVIKTKLYNSDDDNYPHAICIHDNRLGYGGGNATPGTFILSKVGDYLNMDEAGGRDSDAINFTIGSNRGVAINNMVSDGSLIIFTNDSEYASSGTLESSVVTPTTISMKEKSTEGFIDNDEYIKPQKLDGYVIFPRKGGKAIMALEPNETATSYEPTNISSSASHLISNTKSIAAYTASNKYDIKALFVVDEDNGLNMLESMKSENVEAWTRVVLQNTNHKIEYVCELGDDIFFLVNRGNRYFIEKLKWDLPLDCHQPIALTGGIESTVTLPAPFTEGDTVSIISDFAETLEGPTYNYIGDYTVDENTQITVTPPVATGNYIVGYKFKQQIDTLPAHVMTYTGDTLSKKKCIKEAFVNYHKSATFTVNDTEVPTSFFYTNGDQQGITFGSEVYLDTNISSTYITRDAYSRSVYLTIKQENPLPLTILGIQYTVTI